MFKLLGAETRMRILELLQAKGPLLGKDIARRLQVTPAAVSQHMRYLRLAGLVIGQREGTSIPYSVNTKALKQILKSTPLLR